MWNNNKNYNYVVCRSAYTIQFNGIEDLDWAQGLVSAAKSAKYHLFVAGSGAFIRKGKGGYVNWAWKGSVKKGQDLHSNVVTFVKPGSIGSDVESGGD
ncbi:hypothetical protein JOM56_011598 [Amanita muscaria]